MATPPPSCCRRWRLPRRSTAGELATFHELVERFDLEPAASALDRGGNGDKDARNGLAALTAGRTRAAAAELGLLLVCFPA